MLQCKSTDPSKFTGFNNFRVEKLRPAYSPSFETIMYNYRTLIHEANTQSQALILLHVLTTHLPGKQLDNVCYISIS